MIDPGLKDKVVLITGGNNPHGIGAAIARAFAAQGAKVFIHFYRYVVDMPGEAGQEHNPDQPGLSFFFKQQAKNAEEVFSSIRDDGGIAEAWEGDLRDPVQAYRLFESAEKAFGQ